MTWQICFLEYNKGEIKGKEMKSMDKDLRKYEEQLVKEIEGYKWFSFKRIAAAIKLDGICKMLSK